MIPTIASSGTSFKGAAAYYLHDKDADSCERIAWTHTENLLTDDAERGWKVMAWTAKNQFTLKRSAGTKATGRKLEKPVFAFSVAWHPEQKPDKAHMLATAKSAAAALGLSEHQAIYVSHNDEPQPHVHVLVNRVHPLTGKAATLSRSKEKLSAWAPAYQREQGETYCPAREKNARRRAERVPGREGDPVIQEAWQKSDSGRSFQAALAARKYTLARGNRRLVVIDRWGKAHSPVRHLANVRTAAFNARLRDIDMATLPTAATVQKRLKQEQRKEYAQNRKFERWSAAYLNKNQDRQIEERARLSERYQRLLDEKKAELARHYKLDQREKEIAQLRERLVRPTLLRRLSGKAARDREALADQQKSYDDARQRMAEAVGAIETERSLAVADQATAHERENELARQYLEDRKPAFYRAEEPAQEKEAARGGRRDRGRDDDGDGGRERVFHRHRPGKFGI